MPSSLEASTSKKAMKQEAKRSLTPKNVALVKSREKNVVALAENDTPLKGLDGCHLKGPHKGILIMAITLDTNDHIFPIVYAIVEIKNMAT